MADLHPIALLAVQAAHHLGLSEEDVIASAVTETEVVLVFRQGWKRRVPLSDLPVVSTETADEGEGSAAPDHLSETSIDEVEIPVASTLESETPADEGEGPARPRRRRGA